MRHAYVVNNRRLGCAPTRVVSRDTSVSSLRKLLLRLTLANTTGSFWPTRVRYGRASGSPIAVAGRRTKFACTGRSFGYSITRCGVRFAARSKFQYLAEPALRANALPPRLYRSAAD